MEQRLSGFNHILKERTQTVSVGSSHSKYETLKYGVPQGSVLGPIHFSIYNSPIGEIIEKHNICYHLYADGGQLYLAFSPKDSLSQKEVKEKMIKCAKDVKSSSEQAHNLGIIFDKEINSRAQINNISKAGYYHVRNLAAICNTLDLDSAKMAAHAFVTSTLDYGNSIVWLTIFKAQKVANGSKCISQGINTRKEIRQNQYDCC